MIELYLWLFIMLLVSIIARTFYRNAHTPGFKTIFDVIAFIGVFIHELAHYTLGILFGTKMGGFSVKYHSKTKIKVAPHGWVDSPEFERNSFIQTFVISFAPLYVSTFLFMFCLDIILHIQTLIWIKIIAGVFCVSLLIGSEPSGQDIKLIGVTFNKNPRYSLYQIFLVVLSGTIVWMFIDLYFIILPFEVLYYIEYFIFVALFYFSLKFVFWVIGKIIKGIMTFYGKNTISSPKFLTRKRRFKEYIKQKEKEAQW
ncbi:MAG: hypothetical protein HWN80_04730 [Candidatus Lokiarchaeota archaeon]|nr:hypothetical protein [Candidatus Lokiarchaeota archaeon]